MNFAKNMSGALCYSQELLIKTAPVLSFSGK